MQAITSHAAHPRGLSLRWRLALWSAAAGLLLIPAIAMQFTAEVRWTALDFTVMALMLALTCGGIELAARLLRSRRAFAIAVAVVLALFLLVWGELAVDIV